MRFKVDHSDGQARAGTLETSRGLIDTPTFMPCATTGAVRAVRWSDLESLDYRLILMNALHLHLRPGLQIIRDSHGMHDFTSWRGSILTDSGGYQFFSLKGLYKIDDEGVSFQSPYDGSRHRFDPEYVIDLQTGLGSDIIMPLDHCASGNASQEEFISAGERTIRWLGRARERYRQVVDPKRQALFGIVQGGTDSELRRQFVERTVEFDLNGYAIGGISVGEDKDRGDEVVNEIAPMLPADKPRYLMGVGLPEQILSGIGSGIDMFDCVLPTRMARNGTLFTSRGRLNLKNSGCRTEPGPLDPDCTCIACSRYSVKYLSHVYRTGEPGVLSLLSVHNLAYYKNLVSNARQAISEGRFDSWREEIVSNWQISED